MITYILELNKVSKSFTTADGFAVEDVSLKVVTGEVLALLGESGSGKTTMLRMIAGFERPTSGEILIDGRRVAGNGVFIEPEERGIGVVFQDYALFPHLKVKENMAFGLKGLDRSAKARRIKEMMELTETVSLEERYPHELSGGQKQRIALARALAPGPALILFDEPFSSIDSMIKMQMRKEIRRIVKTAGSTAVFVTHDTRDAMAMADRICMLRKGKSIQTGTPGELYDSPRNAYVANFFGKTNLIPAEVTDRGLMTALGLFPYEGTRRRTGERVLLSVRPESFVMKDDKENCICGNIVDKNFMGDYNELVCEVITANGSSERVVIRISPERSCEDKQCYFMPRKNKIHILNENTREDYSNNTGYESSGQLPEDKKY
jgi:iron(III) transport system ATP-binding protein